MADPETERPAHPFAGDPVFDLHLGGKLETVSTVALTGRDELSLAYTPGRGAGLPGDRRGPGAHPALHVGAQHGRRRHRRHRRARARRHRSRGRDARDGGQGGALQAVRRRRRRPDLPGHHRHRGDHRDRRPARARASAASTSRTSRRRAASRSRTASRRCSTSPSSTTTSTARPSSRSPRSRNALRLTGRDPATTRVVISGAGAAGVAVAKILLGAGVRDLAVDDRQGVLSSRRTDLTPVKAALARMTTDTFDRHGSLAEVLAGADVFIGVSGGTVPEEVVASMAPESVIFGLANPNPEVHPDVANRHARVVATGRSRLPEPDQQRAGVPRHLPRRLRRPRDGDHRGHEARRCRRAGRPRRRRPGRGPHRPVAVRPAWVACPAVAEAARRDGSRGVVPRKEPGFDRRWTAGSRRRSTCLPPRTPSSCWLGRHVRRVRRVVLDRVAARRPGGGGAPRARGARRLDHGHGARPPRSTTTTSGRCAAWACGRAAADDPRLRRRRVRRGRQRGGRARRDQRSRAGRATRPSTPSARCSPSGSRAPSPSGSPCRGATSCRSRASLSFEEAACLPTAWLTAYRMLFTQGGCSRVTPCWCRAPAVASRPPLITLARAGGLRVYATSRDEAKRAKALELGAHEVFEPGERLPSAVDAVIETVGRGDVDALDRVAATGRDGRGAPARRPAPARRRRAAPGSSSSSCESSARPWAPARSWRSLMTMMDATGVRPVIDRTLPMEPGARRVRRDGRRATSSARSC